MYKQFFGLNRNPFEISPDPFFYHPTPRHNEALANLHYGVGRRKGFIVITGEVGTGKTLLVRCLLAELRKGNIAFGYVFNPLLSTMEFFQYIMADLGLPYAGRSKTEILLDLNRFLIQRHARGLITALVVDEAQALQPDLLEEIRLLTNLETSQQKLLQIVLLGQPELEVLLDSPELRQLKQRIALALSIVAARRGADKVLRSVLAWSGRVRSPMPPYFPMTASRRCMSIRVEFRASSTISAKTRWSAPMRGSKSR